MKRACHSLCLVAEWLESRVRTGRSSVRIPLVPLWNFGNFVYPTLPQSLSTLLVAQIKFCVTQVDECRISLLVFALYLFLRCTNHFIALITTIDWTCLLWYSGTSLLRSPTGLGKSDLNGEVTLLLWVICTVEYNLGLSQGDCNGEVFLLVR